MFWEIVPEPEERAAIAQEEISSTLSDWGLGWALSALMQAVLEHDSRTPATRTIVIYTLFDLTAAALIAEGGVVDIDNIDFGILQLVFEEETRAGWDKVGVLKRLLETFGSATVLSAIADWVSDPEHRLGNGITVDQSQRSLVICHLERARDWASGVYPGAGAIEMLLSQRGNDGLF